MVNFRIRRSRLNTTFTPQSNGDGATYKMSSWWGQAKEEKEQHCPFYSPASSNSSIIITNATGRDDIETAREQSSIFSNRHHPYNKQRDSSHDRKYGIAASKTGLIPHLADGWHASFVFKRYRHRKEAVSDNKNNDGYIIYDKLKQARSEDNNDHGENVTYLGNRQVGINSIKKKSYKRPWIITIAVICLGIFGRWLVPFIIFLKLQSIPPITPQDALWRQTILPRSAAAGSQYKYQYNTEIDDAVDLVISHCDHSIDWIHHWIGDTSIIHNITIFSKCNNTVEGAPKNANIIRLENVGRCDHSYAHYMARYNIPPSRFVLFLKDNDNLRRTLSRHRSFDELLAATKMYGFACHEERHLAPLCELSAYHDFDSLMNFQQTKPYIRLERDRKDTDLFSSTHGDTLGEYISQLKIDIEGEILPVCYGGIFMTTSEQIKYQTDNHVWDRIEASLTRASNIAEGHFVERLWAALLSKPLTPDQIDTILGQLNTVSSECFEDPRFPGVLTKLPQSEMSYAEVPH